MTSAPLPGAPTHVGQVTLLARDLPALTQFYAELLGLSPLEQAASQVTLGTPEQPLLTLRAAPHLPAPALNRPGLYHTAFLQPTRADLGRWLAHAARLGVSIGSGDHLVSEAFYLSDPEGNGIEVYADRPRDTWTWVGGQVQMDTRAVDAAGVLDAAGLTPASLHQPPTEVYTAPAGLSVGHVHLKVGDAQQAARFYREALGLDVVADLGSATFLSWGGYHHHLGLNEWHTRGQGRPQIPAAGLAEVELVAPDLDRLRGRPDTEDHGDHVRLRDPWGNLVRVRGVRPA